MDGCDRDALVSLVDGGDGGSVLLHNAIFCSGGKMDCIGLGFGVVLYLSSAVKKIMSNQTKS